MSESATVFSESLSHREQASDVLCVLTLFMTFTSCPLLEDTRRGFFWLLVLGRFVLLFDLWFVFSS